jgi:hypothetical protein
MYRCIGCDTPSEMGHHEDCLMHERACNWPQCSCGPQDPGGACEKQGHRVRKINISSGEDADSA